MASASSGYDSDYKLEIEELNISPDIQPYQYGPTVSQLASNFPDSDYDHDS